MSAAGEPYSNLTPREVRVLRMRFGIGMESTRTREEVGEQYVVSSERIRQIESKALRKLKHPSRKRELHGFLQDLRDGESPILDYDSFP